MSENTGGVYSKLSKMNMKKIIKKIVKTPKGYAWVGTTKINNNRTEMKYVLLQTLKQG
jgi:hypothetical protein